ncbi:hypothetical protein [Streptomyces canus]|uniref:hypothetical protein n=1 Tax=Streptomyces canus TaxID=58343 RepID=UPI0030E2F933
MLHRRLPPLVSHAVLDLGTGIAAWYREDGELTEDTIVWWYGDFALRLAGVSPENQSLQTECCRAVDHSGGVQSSGVRLEHVLDELRSGRLSFENAAHV